MNFTDNISGIIDEIELEKTYDKSIIKFRFLDEISYYEKQRDHTKKYYNAFRFIVTTGSILLPAVLSMGQMDPTKLPKNFDMISFWTSWVISLMVTASNGFLQLFSLDKNYFAYSMVVEQLKTEGWQYFGLSGKYEDYESHQEAYKVFSKSIESIKRKQVEQEFSNGKGEGKKKKFDFKGEMKKFSEEQNINIIPPIEMIQSIPTLKTLQEEIKEKVVGEIKEKVVGEIKEKVVGEIKEKVVGENITIEINDS